MSSIVIQGDTSGSITVEAPSVAGTHTLTLPKATGNIATDATVGLGTKNLIINGDMRIAQRGTSAVTGTSGYPVDRWLKVDNTSAYYSSQQSSTVPSTLGIASSIYNVVTTPTTATGSIEKNIQYRLEGNHIAHLGYGTANAKTCTLSFWVRSNTTGTYCVSMREGTSVNRCYIVEYTINSADTWEQKTITFTGDTGGTWLSDNSRAMIITWDLGSGSSVQTATINSWHASAAVRTSNQTNWVNTSGATFYITGVQLEVGENATPFEYRPYDMELARCMRYYQQFPASSQWACQVQKNHPNTQNRILSTAILPVPIKNFQATVTIPSSVTNRGWVEGGNSRTSIGYINGNNGQLQILTDYSGIDFSAYSINIAGLISIDAEL